MRKTLVSLVLACCLTLFTALASCALAAPSAPPSGYTNSYVDEYGVRHNDAVLAISTSGSPNIISWDGSAWKKTSYGGSYGNGYDIWYQVKNGSSHLNNSGSSKVNERYSLASDGFENSSIQMKQEIVFGGQFVRTTFIVENNSSKDMEISFGSGADIQIDDDDRASINERSDYGFQMTATNGNRRSFYFFGHDTPTVDRVDYWWVGQYSSRNSYYYYDAAGKGTSHNVTSTDSGMVYTWNKVRVPAGQTVKRSVLFGVGEADHVEQYLPVEVKFDSRGGTPVPSAAVVKGNKVPVPSPNPTRDGYEFAGWYKDASCRNPFNFNTTINSAMTLYAKWNYVISFGGGDDGLPNHQITVDPDNPRLPDTLPVPPSKDDEEFQGWFSDPECTKPVKPGDTISGPTIFYPKWTPKYTVSFDTHGAGTIASQTVVEGNLCTKPETPVRDGYQFAGWYTDESCTNKFDFNNGIHSNTTLHAKWNYVVSFGDGSDGLANNTIIVDPDNPHLPDTLPVPPSRDDEEFQGWFADPECTIPVKPGASIDCPTIFYPKWTPKYTISFDAPGCKPIPPQCIVEGSTCPQPENPVRDGYHFDGWYTDKECTNKFDFGSPITCPVELHAKLDYVVSFGDGTDGLTDYQIIVDCNNPHLPGTLPVPPEREDEEFKGWFYDPECTKPVKPGDTISGPTVLYPNWPSRHTVVFDTNGGTPIPPVKVTDGNLLPMPAEPTKPNNTFGGWSYIDPNCNCKKPFDPSKPITDGITIIVDWLPHIDFSTDPENPLPPIVVPPDGHIDLPTPPSKPDSSFAGWFEDPEFTKPFDPTKPIDGPIILYPKYVPLPKTGDNTPLFLLIAALLISGTAFAFAARKKHA